LCQGEGDNGGLLFGGKAISQVAKMCNLSVFIVPAAIFGCSVSGEDVILVFFSLVALL
jgi:hypothetical protein